MEIKKGCKWSSLMSTIVLSLLKFYLAFLCTINETARGDMTKLLIYLTNYGYLPSVFNDSVISKLISNKSLSKALMEFQSFSGLNVTGILDSETQKLMDTPRCGFPDLFQKVRRSKRYSLGPTKWSSRNLTYGVTKYSSNPHLSKEQIHSDVEKAFQIWSDQTSLTFTKTEGTKVDIEVRFEVKDHGDVSPFDGRGNVLAHAFFPGPGLGGDAHFDDDEYWSIDTKPGIKIDRVATHEFGHSLGLGHSRNRNAVMYAYYRSYKPITQLHSDDIAGIQVLYGSKKTDSKQQNSMKNETCKTNERSAVTVKVRFRRPSTTKSNGTKYSSDETSSNIPQTTATLPVTVSNGPQLCLEHLIKYTIFTDLDNRTYLFSKFYYWELTDNGLLSPYPKIINTTWIGLPGHIDAAFVYKNRTYFFKGRMYWQYEGTVKQKGFPKLINQEFSGLPICVDSAFALDDKVYAFKGFYYWKYPPSYWISNNRKFKYPIAIGAWGKGLPGHLNSVMLHSDGLVYFFHGDKFWRFNYNQKQREFEDPPFPRSVKKWWLHCKPDGQKAINF